MVLGIRPKDSVPPREGGGVIPNEVHVVEIVMPSTSIKRDVVQWVERDIVTTGTRDGLYECIYKSSCGEGVCAGNSARYPR